jgi:hypothetical protein
MKYWIIRMPEPRPFGDTSRRAIFRAMSVAEPVNVLGGGCVESVVTRRTHFRVVLRFFVTSVVLRRLGVFEIELFRVLPDW